MTTTIKLVNGALEVVFDDFTWAKVDAIKQLHPGTRSYNEATKVWTVDPLVFEELLELLPDAEVAPEVWTHVYPSYGARVPEVLAQCRRWAESGVRLVRDGDRLTAAHDTAPAKDLAPLQPHIDEIAEDINRLLAMGHRVPGVQAGPVLNEDDARMFAFMQQVRQNRGRWEKNAQKKQRMIAKGRYHG